MTTYWKGDKAEYTGKVLTIHGGLFYEIVMLEGRFKGESKVTVVAPKSVEDDQTVTCDRCGRIFLARYVYCVCRG